MTLNVSPEPICEMDTRLTQVERALETRDTIGMAKGILMAREACGPDEAFEMLKRASHRTNRRVASIAAEIVQSNAQRAPAPLTTRPLTPEGVSVRKLPNLQAAPRQPSPSRKAHTQEA